MNQTIFVLRRFQQFQDGPGHRGGMLFRDDSLPDQHRRRGGRDPDITAKLVDSVDPVDPGRFLCGSVAPNMTAVFEPSGLAQIPRTIQDDTRRNLCDDDVMKARALPMFLSVVLLLPCGLVTGCQTAAPPGNPEMSSHEETSQRRASHRWYLMRSHILRNHRAHAH